MVFSSVTFLFVFLPIVFILYSVLPSLRWKNLFLVIASLIFYAFGEPYYVLLLIASSFVNYLLGLLISRHPLHKKVFAIIAVFFNLSVIGTFKYTAFLTGTVNALLHLSLPIPDIALPIGISFFTFQALSYVIDVYRDPEMAQKHYGKVLLYISFFPQLIAGPIIKYHDINKEIDNRHQSFSETASGIRRFIIGLAKKVLIANSAGTLADTVFSMNSQDLSVPVAWVGAICYTLQIYYDFSGYSDMAIGLGHMFGFSFKENFNYPYISGSIKEFWRRWHISLSTWFKEYLYIPLGGNRKGKIRTSINKIFVFFCTGLWHGANWTFVLWGMMHGLAILLEDWHIIPVGKKSFRFLGHIYTMLVVVITFVFFRADTVAGGAAVIMHMFVPHASAYGYSLLMQSVNLLVVFLVLCGVIGCLPIRQMILQHHPMGQKQHTILEAASYLLSMALLAWSILYLSSGTFNPFIYFRF